MNDRVYVWKRTHVHMDSFVRQPCVEVLSIYMEGEKRSPLRLRFKQDDTTQWEIGYPQNGVLRQIGDSMSINLNQPAVVAAIIKHAIIKGWDPLGDQKPFEIERGIDWIVDIDFKD